MDPEYKPQAQTNYIDCITQYENIVFKSQNTPQRQVKAVELLSESTYYIDDAYHTQGTVLHVTCPEPYRNNCYDQMSECFFVCSIIENWNFAQKTSSNSKIKYIERYLEAMLILLLKLLGLTVDMPLKGSLLYCKNPNDPNPDYCMKYNKYSNIYTAIYNKYTKAVHNNNLRKSNEPFTIDNDLKDYIPYNLWTVLMNDDKDKLRIDQK